MKPVLMRRLLAASMFATPFVHAAEAAPEGATTPPLMLRAMTAMAHEVQNAMEDGGDLNKNLERLSSFQHTPETARLLTDAFGNAHPWSLEKRGVEKDRNVYRWSVQAVDQTTPAGNTLAWSEFPLDLRVDKAGKSMDYRGNLSSLSFEDATTRITVRDAGLLGAQRRGAANLWYGTVQAGLGSLQIDSKDKPFTMLMRDMVFKSTAQEQARTVGIAQSFGIKSIEFAGERIDEFKMAYRLVNVDKAALGAMRAAEKKMSAAQVANKDDLATMLPLLKAFVRGAVKHKTTLQVDEMGFAYNGHKALLRGRVAFDRVSDAELADMTRLAKRVNARFQLKVPVALVREFGTAMARRQAEANKQQPQDSAAMGQAIADAMVGKLVTNGYARLENDTLVSTITVSNGVLRVNGKKVDLPKPRKDAAETAEQHHPAIPQLDKNSCTLPDYPAEVVKEDDYFGLTLKFVVNKKGEPQDLEITEESAYPEYDAAVLAAFAGCRFTPAFKGGEPIDYTLYHSVMRELGSLRP